MSEFTPFRCAECGQKVTRARPRPDVLWDMGDGVRLPLPAELLIPSCDHCNESYIDTALGARIEAALEAAFVSARVRSAAKAIDRIIESTGISQRALEDVCGVSAGYLSKVRHGERNVSVTLLRLLEAFAACPAEVDRHIGRRSWDEEHQLRLLLTKLGPGADARRSGQDPLRPAMMPTAKPTWKAPVSLSANDNSRPRVPTRSA
jgi:transcriptional regulator with XRE-family HTH domain